MKRRGILTALAAALVLGALTLPAAGRAHRAQALDRAVLALDGGRVTLEALVPFAWDRAFCFPAYTSREEMEAVTGVKSRALRGGVSEEQFLLVFVKGDRASAVLTPSRRGWQLYFDGPVSRGEHRSFAAERTADGEVSLREAAP